MLTTSVPDMTRLFVSKRRSRLRLQRDLDHFGSCGALHRCFPLLGSRRFIARQGVRARSEPQWNENPSVFVARRVATCCQKIVLADVDGDGGIDIVKGVGNALLLFTDYP